MLLHAKKIPAELRTQAGITVSDVLDYFFGGAAGCAPDPGVGFKFAQLGEGTVG